MALDDLQLTKQLIRPPLLPTAPALTPEVAAAIEHIQAQRNAGRISAVNTVTLKEIGNLTENEMYSHIMMHSSITSTANNSNDSSNRYSHCTIFVLNWRKNAFSSDFHH